MALKVSLLELAELIDSATDEEWYALSDLCDEKYKYRLQRNYPCPGCFSYTYGPHACSGPREMVLVPIYGAAPTMAFELTEFSVIVTSFTNKAKLIAAIRQLNKKYADTPMSDLIKKLYELPCVIVEAAYKSEAKEIQQKLEAAGATVELR